MFTGIIEEMGRVKDFKRALKKAVLTVKAQKIMEDIETGVSIALNGVCLTVIDHQKDAFSVEISPETLSRTNIGSLKIGNTLNLERSLQFGSRLGGHMVTGHIDGPGKILSRTTKGNSVILKVQFPHHLKGQIVPQGSITIDGVSLTVAEIKNDAFTVSIVPHTAEVTSLGKVATGAKVNLETDLIGKYVKELLVSKGMKAQMISFFGNRGALHGLQSH